MIILIDGFRIPINENLLDSNEAWINLKEIIGFRKDINNLMLEEKTLLDNAEFTEVTAKKLLDKLNDIEYGLARAWNFNPNSDYFTYWLQLSACKCPKMDNRERIGTSLRVVHPECLYHNI